MHKIRVLSFYSTRTGSGALRLPSHTVGSSFLTAHVVVYTPIMLGSAFTAHAHKHTLAQQAANRPHRLRGDENRKNGFCDHPSRQQQLSPHAAHTHTNTTMIEHSPHGNSSPFGYRPRRTGASFSSWRTHYLVMKRKPRSAVLWCEGA